MYEPLLFPESSALTLMLDSPEAAAEIRSAADNAMQGELFTITRKTNTPPSGDKRDYCSMGPYWWPDPGKPDGLPYIRRDGKVNPETLHTDRQTLEAMIAAVSALAAGWEAMQKIHYAQRAAEILHTFFVDERTRMNPHLRFAQAVPGHCEGRGIGIIDTRSLVRLLDNLCLLRSADVVAEEPLQTWFSDYCHWLRESPFGKEEANEHNNHGTWYDVQVGVFALYAEQRDVAREALQQVEARRMAKQIAADGSQPHEIVRTLGLGYSTMNLEAFFWLARLGERVGVALWDAGAGHRAINNAVDFLAPYWMDPATWPTAQTKPFDQRAPIPLLFAAAEEYGQNYGEMAQRLAGHSR